MTTGCGTLDCPPARTLISAARVRRGLPLTPGVSSARQHHQAPGTRCRPRKARPPCSVQRRIADGRVFRSQPPGRGRLHDPPAGGPGSGSGSRHDRGIFPGDLGAVIRRTVLSGELPAWLVIHDDENDWCVGDDANDPDVLGTSVIAHMTHVFARDPSVSELASLPPGWAAARTGTGQPWERSCTSTGTSGEAPQLITAWNTVVD
jgi:hypothetical protein